MKYFVFGDTGGHFLPLKKALISLGANLETYTLPENTTIIHLGDLIHKGPHSDLIVNMVDNFITKNPSRWVQIMGNHEFEHTGGPHFWRCDCSPNIRATLNKWWDNKITYAAYALTDIEPPNLEISAKPKMLTNSQDWFFSHGGLTESLWNTLGSLNATETAERINSLPVKRITRAGELLGQVDPNVGCVWAIGSTEVYNSWVKKETYPPFNQVYGHTTSFDWKKKTWWGGGFGIKQFVRNSKTNPDIRAVITNLGDNHLMVGIDPGYSNYATQKQQSYITLEKL